MEKNLKRVFPLAQDSSWYSDLIKRAVDIAVSIVALVLLAPFLCVIAVAIKRDSSGPVFYRGARAGRRGNIFNILKFRTMYERPESYSGPRVTAHDDPRVTPLGRWLRNTKLNELPQFWNVLKGEMSLVGPRPEDPDIALKWPRAVWDDVLSVRPGITSPASVLYHDEEALLSTQDVFRQYVQKLAPDKVRLDQLYVRHRSFWLDLDTLLWTMLIMIPRVSSDEPPEKLLFVGPITRFVSRYVNWFVADFLVALAAVGFTGILWRVEGALNVGWPRAIAAAFGLAFLFSITGTVLGVNRITWSKAAPRDAYDLLVAWATAATIAFTANLLTGVLPSGLVLLASVLALAGFVAVRYRSRLAIGLLSRLVRHRVKARGNCERVLIVGSGPVAQHVAWILDRRANSRKLQLLGFVDDDLFAQGMRIYGAHVLGTCQDIPKLVTKHDIGVIILADHGMTPDQHRSIVEFCCTTKTRLAVMPNMVDSLSNLCRGSLPTSETGGVAKDGVGFHCLECMTRHGIEQVASLLQQSDGAEVL